MLWFGRRTEVPVHRFERPVALRSRDPDRPVQSDGRPVRITTERKVVSCHWTSAADERTHVAEIAVVVVLPGAARTRVRRLADDTPVAEDRADLVAVHDRRPAVFAAALCAARRGSQERRVRTEQERSRVVFMLELQIQAKFDATGFGVVLRPAVPFSRAN